MFCVHFPALPSMCGCVDLWHRDCHIPGTLRSCLEAQQPQTLRVTLIFSARAVSAWMTAPMGYVGRGL